MQLRLLPAAAVFGAAALITPVAHAQPTCMARDTLIEQLTERYDEVPVGRGLQSASQLFEVWASIASGTYTVFVTRPDGLACIVATGQNWSSFDIAAAPQGILG
jgi:hypothetical protein